jgi:phosphoribosylanthranilate isomerase
MMRKKMKVKICGIKDPEIAAFSALKGADFIGIIRAPSSKRFVSLEQAKEIARAAREAGAEVVAVYVNSDEEEIIRECEALKITKVQHYGPHLILPANFTQLHVNKLPDEFREGDFLLFDHPEGGQGKPFCWHSFQPPQNHPWFLAGGLTAMNVKEAIRLLKPYGVDVSTGVETAGKKDKGLIEAFLHEVKYAR